MIDLHTHTWYSDGALSPEQLVRLARERGIDTLSITDHDGIFGLEEGRRCAGENGIRFIDGVELSAALRLSSGFPSPKGSARDKQGGGMAYLHILGYGFDPENKALGERLEEIRRQRGERNDRLLRELERLGYPLSREDLEAYPGQDYIGKPNFARALVRRGYASSVAEAFSSELMMAAPEIKAVHRAKIDAKEAVALISNAGGFAVLAHPYKVFYPGKWEDPAPVYLEKLELILRSLIDLGLDGMECWYSGHTPLQEQELLKLAAAYHLTVTAGSDYHGPGMKEGVELGGIHGKRDLQGQSLHQF